MRRSPIVFLVLFCTAGAAAQGDQYVISRQASVTLFPVYQSWTANDADIKFSQFNTMLSAYLPVGRSLSFSLRGGGATSGGDVPKLSGLADTQLGVSYYLESINIVFSLGVNAPTGKQQLTRDEFLTSILFSNSLFNLQVPALGQGLNLNPGISWVFPLTDGVVLGLAAAYQYRGPYKPRDGLAEYDPGDEVTASGGVDVRVTETISVSTDFVFTTYAADTYDKNKVFATGNSYWGNLQYRQYFREDELLVFVGYRTRSKGQIAGAGGLVDEQERLEPGRADILTQFRQVFSPRFSMSYILEGRIFETTTGALSGAKVVGVGVAPTFSLGGGLSVPARVKAQYGKLKGSESIIGIEAGIGLGYTF